MLDEIDSYIPERYSDQQEHDQSKTNIWGLNQEPKNPDLPESAFPFRLPLFKPSERTIEHRTSPEIYTNNLSSSWDTEKRTTILTLVAFKRLYENEMSLGGEVSIKQRLTDELWKTYLLTWLNELTVASPCLRCYVQCHQDGETA